MGPALAIAIAAFAAYLAMAPRVVNGDGLGYLKAALAGTLYPGHVAFVPLLRQLGRLTGATRPLALLWPARVISALAAAIAIVAVAALARRRGGPHGRAAATTAALGMAASWGVLAAGSDVESYAPALAALALAAWAADGDRPVTAGLCTAAATLFHVENVLFVAPVWLWLPRGRGRFLLAAAAPVAAVYGALLASHGLGWLGGASHGLRYPLHPWTPAIALYGACKTLVYAPYPYEASWTRVLGCFAVGAAAATALATCVRRPLPPLVLAAWTVPYAAVGVAFFASDAERWLFLLPLVWLAAATGRPRRAKAVALALAVADVVLWLPVARDDGPRRRAEAAAQQLRAGDLVVGPGHGWDEYVGFYGDAAVTTFPLIYWAGAVGRQALPGTLAQAVGAARARGGRVWLARLRDDGDPMGWKELRSFGITVDGARAMLPAGRAVDVGAGLERWDSQ